ncbi:contact-dependent growth inhibition system immunity protein [Amycolatopsis thermoflava]|uniref:contact-dependent growth inhibition system immunity protein n=1 Tax=Amycolatopsis thermoflava TaxID=84480 RepID=UPI003664F13E
MTHLSLEQLEDDYWGDPPPGTTYLISTCHRMRRVPLDELDAEGVRILLGQQIGVPHLVPRALQILNRDPFAETHFGYLVDALRRIPEEYWTANPVQHADFERVRRRAGR